MERSPRLTDAPPPYGTIVFDCDSTLSHMEGIESLASESQGPEISQLTNAAMCGEVALEEAFARRLDIVRPSRSDLAQVGREYMARVVANAPELVAALRFLGKRVVIVSGGLQPAVEDFAQQLGIDEVYAVGVQFDDDGRYDGFDPSSPLARTGGKIDVLGQIVALDDSAPLAFIGDGMTDLEAAHCAARFIAFGGVIRRDVVFRGALVTCASPDLRDLVPLLLSATEIARLRAAPAHAALLPHSR